MALFYCREIQGRQGTSSGIFETEMNRTWRVRVSSKTDDIYAILGQLQLNGTLPLRLSRHPANLFCTCRSMSVKDDESGLVYTVTAVYSSSPLSQDDRNRVETPNPLNRTPRRWVERAEYDKATDKDRDGNGICTSAGTKFPEPAYIPANDFIIQVRQNVTSWPQWVEAYNNKVNSQPLVIKPTAINVSRTYDAGTVLFKYNGCGEPQEENGVIYVEISYSLHIRETWKHSVLDEDIYYKEGEELKRIQVDGEDAAIPVPLDGEGGVLENPTSDTVVFREFDVIQEVDMVALSILNT